MERETSKSLKRGSALRDQMQLAEDKILVSGMDKVATQLPIRTNCRRTSSMYPRANSHVIRSRFLNRLGISTSGTGGGSVSKHCCSNSRDWQNKSFCESLKADCGESDPTIDDDISWTTEHSSSTESFRSQLSAMSMSPTRGGVSFCTSVTVHPIPARSAYSDRMRKQMWTPAETQALNTARNIYEFAAEEWDWTKVVDDEFFFNYNGERIHPIHLQDCNLNEHFLSVMAQR